MAKKRVYELARELNIESNEMLDILSQEGIVINNILRTLDDKVVDLMREKFGKNKPQEQKLETSNTTSAEIIMKETKDTSIKEENKVNMEPKTSISETIRQRMRSSSLLKEKSTVTRTGLKDKLALRTKQEDVNVQNTEQNEEVKTPEQKQEIKDIKDVEERKQKPLRQEFQKKKIKQISAITKEIPTESIYSETAKKDAMTKDDTFDKNGVKLPLKVKSKLDIVKKPVTSEKVAPKWQDKKPAVKGKKVKEKPKERDFKKEKEYERDLFVKSSSKRKRKDEKKFKKEDTRIEPLTNEIEVFDGMTVKEIADKIRVKETDVIKELFMKGIMVTVNQSLEPDVTKKIIEDHGFTVKEPEVQEDRVLELKVEEMFQDEELLKPRPPVVAIMGHVDHGKTSLLDAIRKSKITEKEAGGITQHIGAYQVEVSGRVVTFLDTPGHEAFTAMRARGAKATDIAILVVAADDGVMPQTIEAINHAKAASVPILVALNKIDKPDTNPERIKQQLAEHELVPEEWGGKTVIVPVSAKTQKGLDDLLEMILLTADLQDIRSNPDKAAQGVIIESRLDKGKGPIATVLIQTGTLHVGEYFISGSVCGKVRAMYNYLGQEVKEATPSTPVQVIGFSAVPSAGELFQIVESEKEARDISEELLQNEKSQSASRYVSLDSISQQIKEGKIKELNLVIKADVQGSCEALVQSLSKVSTDEVKVRVIHSGAGEVSEADITLAITSSAIVIAFNVKADVKARDLAESEKIDIRSYNIIYRAIEDVQKAVDGLLEPEMEEVLIGKASVKTLFSIGKSNVIAGCYVTEGKIQRNSIVKLIRKNDTIHSGKINTLKRFKDDVREVQTGYECGISIDNFNDIKEDDIIESYILQAKS